jgi:hypothetical protein
VSFTDSLFTNSFIAKGVSVEDEPTSEGQVSSEPTEKIKSLNSKAQTFSNPNVSTGAKPKPKRKAVGEGVTSQDDKDRSSDKPKKKKPRKESKLLSFGDGED